MNPPPSRRVFVAGVTGSGKSWLVQRVYLPRCTRALIIDPMGSYDALKPSRGKRFLARSVGETLAAMRAAPRSGPAWWIVAQIAPDEVTELAGVLLPTNLTERKPYALAVGGLTLVCEEADLLVPMAAPPEIRALWQRGRHVGLSIIAVSQRPALVNRVVTSMSQEIVLCATHEPNDSDYIARLCGPAGVAEFGRLTEYGALVFRPAERRGYRVDKAHRIVAAF